MNVITSAYHYMYNISAYDYVYMLWFKFIFGLTFFKPVGFLFSFVSDYGNEYILDKLV